LVEVEGVAAVEEEVEALLPLTKALAEALSTVPSRNHFLP
jgi:hypothetical protein